MPTSAHHPGESLRRQRHHLRCRRSSREASGKAHRRKDIYVLLVPQWTLQTTPHLTSSTCAIVPRRVALWHLCLRNASWTGGVVTGIYRPPGIAGTLLSTSTCFLGGTGGVAPSTTQRTGNVSRSQKASPCIYGLSESQCLST